MAMIKVDWISQDKQWGVRALVDISGNQNIVLMEERPLVSAQYLHNADYFPACEFCMRSLESPRELLSRLSKCDIANDFLPPPEEFGQVSTRVSVTKCEQCPAIYCSEECRTLAFNRYHRKLCEGLVSLEASEALKSLSHEWKQFHYPPEEATVTLLIKMVATIMSSEHQEQMTNFYKEKSGLEGVPVRYMEEKFMDRLQSMRDLMATAFGTDKSLQLTTQTLADMFGVMARNGQGIGTSSLEHYRRTLIAAVNRDCLRKDEAVAVLDRIDSLEDIIDDVSGQFTHAEGTGLYAMHSKLNHSCEPNAQITFPFNSNTLQVVAIRDIKAGEEITIDYCGGDRNCCSSNSSDDDDDDESMGESMGESVDGGQERREMLKEFYLFDCKCVKCLAELVGQ